MSKRNKLRYQSRGNPYPVLLMTGRVLVRRQDEEAIAAAGKGDVQIYLSTDSLPYNSHVGEYEVSGLEGYLKADVHDGKGWKPLSLEEFFPGREHYFGKREQPRDIVHLCVPILRQAKGATLMRTYREHYVRTEKEE